MKKMQVFCFILAGLLSVLSGVSYAEETDRTLKEEIILFDSEIWVTTNARIVVRENIRVRAMGDQIKRGIFRDLPTHYRLPLGFVEKRPIRFIEVLRDGRPEPYHTADLDNGIRLYIGLSNVFLRPGEVYDYQITYAGDRQLFFKSNYTELYWNVTGNFWNFDINQSVVSVYLPAGARSETIFSECYYGPTGSTNRVSDALSLFYPVRYLHNSVLKPGEGMTVLLRWRNGFVSAPSESDRLRFFIQDNLSVGILAAGFLIVLLYYLIVWAAVGRDPKKGVIMPRFDLPPEISPAAARFIRRMGYDNDVLTAAVVNMAVKGFLIIQEEKGEYTLQKTGQGAEKLSPEEKKIAGQLLELGTEFTFKKENYKEISGATEALKTSLKSRFEKKYFMRNIGYFVPGAVLTVAAVALSLWKMEPPAAVFPMVWIVIWTAACAPLAVMIGRAWKSAPGARFKDLISPGGALFMTLFGLPFAAGWVAGTVFYLQKFNPWCYGIAMAAIVVNFLFLYLLKAPTKAGRAVLDQIEGMKMFLSAAEKDRLNRMTAIDKTAANYEKFLPYAIALGVARQWAEQFAQVFREGDGQRDYRPRWYHGTVLAGAGMAGFGSSFSSSLSSAISSSSSSSGGSSGGGGGGGGGGGW